MKVRRQASWLIFTMKRFRFVILAVVVLVTTDTFFLPFGSWNLSDKYVKARNILTERLNQRVRGMKMNTTPLHSERVILTQSPTTTTSIGDWRVIIETSPTEKCGGIYKTDSFQNLIQTSIQESAKFIYISSECDQQTLHQLQRFELSDVMSILKYTGNATRPIANHFIAVNDTHKMRNLKEMAYKLGVWKTALIQKVLLRNEIDSKGEIDPRAPPVVLSSHIQIVRDKILFHYDAFWALVSIENDGVWSMWVQRLLQELDSWVAFLSVSPANHECTTGKQQINQLDQWKCENNSSFFACIKSLSKYMAQNALMDKESEEEISNWLRMLTNIGYTEPKINSKNRIQQGLVYRTLYHPKIESPLFNMNRSYHDICSKSPNQCPAENVKKSTKKISSYLVTVVFNRELFYDIITYIENIYRPHFTYIAFCGLDMDKFLHFNKLMRARVTFVEMDVREFQRGQYGNRCIEAGMKLNYDVEGMMHLNDDVLLNVWNIHNLPLDRVWFQKALKMTLFSTPTVLSVWEKSAKRGGTWKPWHNKEMGKTALEKGLSAVRKSYNTHPLAKEFIDQVDNNTGGKAMGFHGVSDIAYFPVATFKRYLYAAEVFSPFRIFLELEIPSIIAGITNLKDVVVLKGTYIWYSERKDYAKFYNPQHIFLHSLKISGCLKEKVCKGFLCEQYLPCL